MKVHAPRWQETIISSCAGGMVERRRGGLPGGDKYTQDTAFYTIGLIQIQIIMDMMMPLMRQTSDMNDLTLKSSLSNLLNEFQWSLITSLILPSFSKDNISPTDVTLSIFIFQTSNLLSSASAPFLFKENTSILRTVSQAEHFTLCGQCGHKHQ